eukprot:TRINITY_DN16989_c0_g1_i1.p1 TRINITY_DN16989_c0_g1~~TRINITY_DN16989_c0_g1_i1.p1  ORF type:complete len:291 (+),score=44.95 TRINITY_DN16989_c0_g1_i1:42-914(+)
MKILITGSTGYVGGYLMNSLAKEHEVIGVGCTKGEQRMSLEDKESVEKTINATNPDVVINCAAIAALGKCEEDEDIAYKVNCPKYLADCCADKSAFLIHFSTDIVYHKQTDGVPAATELQPLNVYGKSKAAFEILLSSHATCKSVVLRCSNIFGPPVNGITKFVQWVDSVLRDGTIPGLYSNEMRNFVYIGDISEVIKGILKSRSKPEASGCSIFNMGGPESLSREQVAHIVAKHRGIPNSAVPGKVRTDADVKFPTPLDITFDSSKTFSLFNVAPTRLSDVIADILPKL